MKTPKKRPEQHRDDKGYKRRVVALMVITLLLLGILIWRLAAFQLGAG